jgi:hypothetical protein
MVFGLNRSEALKELPISVDAVSTSGPQERSVEEPIRALDDHRGLGSSRRTLLDLVAEGAILPNRAAVTCLVSVVVAPETAGQVDVANL